MRAKPGVVLTAKTISGVRRMRNAMQSNVGLVITDGKRTSSVQAARLWSKYQKGTWVNGKWYGPGFGALYALYRADWIIAKLEALGPDQAAWARELESLAQQGYYLSDHQRDDAVDFRTRGVSDADRAAIIAAAQAIGAKAVDEGDHIHVEDLA